MPVLLFFWALSINQLAAQVNDAVTPPRPLASSSLSNMDYPKEALRLRQEGLSVALVHVGTNGMVKSCTIQQSSGSPSLDDATCKLFSSMRFKPGRDAQGKAVEADAPFRMNWHLPAK